MYEYQAKFSFVQEDNYSCNVAIHSILSFVRCICAIRYPHVVIDARMAYCPQYRVNDILSKQTNNIKIINRELRCN